MWKLNKLSLRATTITTKNTADARTVIYTITTTATSNNTVIVNTTS